ncbi:helix-turn-helix domain-containing protein [bacterium]|nr:helix-turn-helix domain-containing protein [bacterium]
MRATMKTLGFSDGEVDLYLRLLDMGEATISEALKKIDISRPHAYTLMKILLNKGLVAEVSGKPSRFRVLPPEESFLNLSVKRLQVLEEDKKHVEEGMSIIKARAQSLYKNIDFPSEADVEFMILKGYRHVTEWMTRYYSQTRNTFKVMTCLPSIVDLMMEKPGALDKLTEKKTFPTNMLAAEEMLNDEGFKAYLRKQISKGIAKLRVVPQVPMKMTIYDRFASIIVLNLNLAPEDFIVILVRNKDLIEYFDMTYNLLWEKGRIISEADLK